MISSLLKKSGDYFIGLLISKLLATIAFILLARFFLPDIFGKIVLYATLLTICTYISEVGLNLWYQKNVHDSNRMKLFQEVIVTRLYTAVFAIVFIFIFFLLVPTFSPVLAMAFILQIPAEALLSIMDGYYLERKKPRKISYKFGLRALILICALIFHEPAQMSVNWVIFWYLIGTYASVTAIFPWKQLSGIAFIPLRRATEITRQSAPYALLTVTSLAYARGDQIAIKYLLNDAALGLYGGAYRFLESISLIPTALSHNLFHISAKKSGLSHSHLRRIVFISALVGLIVAGVTFFLSELLIVGLLGAAYAPAVPVMKVFSGVLMLFFINAPLATVVQSSSYVNAFLPLGITNTVLNIVLNIIFVPVFGLLASAFIMLFTEITGLLINIRFIVKIYGKK